MFTLSLFCIAAFQTIPVYREGGYLLQRCALAFFMTLTYLNIKSIKKEHIMDNEEILPNKSLRKLDVLFLHNDVLNRDKNLQRQLIEWARELMAECREEWYEIHNTTIEAVAANDRKIQARKRGKARDNKYAPFRKYFKNLQRQKFKEYSDTGRQLKANAFLNWFWENKPIHIEIPYKKSNQYHKLMRLAQENNREFKKVPIECNGSLLQTMGA